MLQQYSSIKIIDSKDILEELLSTQHTIQKELYDFYNTTPLDIPLDISAKIAKKTEVYIQSFQNIQSILN
jgi:hypothetical protein